MTLGEQLRKAREDKRMTLRALARAMDVSAPFLSNVEHDRRSLTPERRTQAAAALGIDVVLLEASEGYTRELADWIANSPDLIALLRESRDSLRPLRIGCCNCAACRCRP